MQFAVADCDMMCVCTCPFRVKESWGWLQASGLPVHITCVNSYLTALIKEVRNSQQQQHVLIILFSG
jgi:hypothetical protein